jgi:hypothetical protein
MGIGPSMVALRGKEIDSFLARPDPGRPIVLLYGPDAGLVRERAEALLKSAVDDPNDPFSLVRLDGDELSAEPSRLVDEALTIPLFGGRRAIRVRAGSRNFAGGVDALAEVPLKDCRIVIEAGELRPESPLRKACERAKTAVAIACYPDTERDLAKLIDDELKLSNLRIASDARAVLVALLGGDRQASRNELRKLTLYAHGNGEVTLDDVMAVVADASELKIDPIVDGAFAGNPATVETEFGPAPGRMAAQIGDRDIRGNAEFCRARRWISTAALFPESQCRDRVTQLRRSPAHAGHRSARNRSSRHAQAGHACCRHCAARAAFDCGECKAAGIRPSARYENEPVTRAKTTDLKTRDQDLELNRRTISSS